MMYDFAIIGGGPTGYAAAMYAGRLNLKTVIFTGTPGGLIITTEIVENYPGFKKISGFDIFKKVQEHAQDYEITEVSGLVEDIKKNDDRTFTLEVGKESYSAKTILFATGAKYRKLPVEGSEKFENKGVHYCALCDGFAYKEKVVAVIGGSDSAAKEALELGANARKIYMIYRGDKIHPEPINNTRVEKNKKIEVINNTNVTKIVGETNVTAVEVDKPIKGSTTLDLDGVFVAIGQIPQSTLAKKLGVKINQKKEIIIDRYTITNIPGVYAAGDVADTEFKQMITGCAEGVVAAYKAFNFVSA